MHWKAACLTLVALVALTHTNAMAGDVERLRPLALEKAVQQFNEESTKEREATGQLPLTVDEVLAALKLDRSLSEESYRQFEQIADSKALPPEAQLVLYRNLSKHGYRASVWNIALVIKNGTEAPPRIEIRRQYIQSNAEVREAARPATPPKAPQSDPWGPAPILMFAQLKGDNGINFRTHSAVMKRATNVDGTIGVPGSQTVSWSTSLKLISATTASGARISDADLRSRLAASTLVVVSMTDGIVPPGFLVNFKDDTIVLVLKDVNEVRRLLRIATPEFEPGTEPAIKRQ